MKDSMNSKVEILEVKQAAPGMQNSFSRIALAGNPNCGKTALFNALTGGRAKVGNYPGVTVERKEGTITSQSGQILKILDLPGTYSLDARTPDEMITRDVLFESVSTKDHLEARREDRIDAIIAVADATNLERCLGFVLELARLGKPMVLALNMMDLAEERELKLDLAVLSRELGFPIIPTVAIRREGIQKLLSEIESVLAIQGVASKKASKLPAEIEFLVKTSPQQIRSRFTEVDRILKLATLHSALPTLWTDKIDRIVMHPVWGTLLLGVVLAFIFQAIFTWAQVPMDAIKAGVDWLGSAVSGWIPEGPLQSLLVDGIIAGVGSILVFLPQILLLFLFILFLEDAGYLPRAAFLMDRLMGKVGLHGRAFIPLLSSYACAIPGIMATRTIENRRDRLTTILVAPLMTCSARLPVYSLLIAAFIPNREVWGPIRLQGLVMFLLYLAGIVAALLMAVVFRMTLLKGAKPALLMELPSYKWPSVRGISIGLWERSVLFLRRAGTVILSVSVFIWFLSSYPKPPVQATGSAISYSYAGKIGQTIEPLVAPIGFNWKIAVALIPGFIAREVMVGSLGTVYAVENQQDGETQVLSDRLAKDWSVATAISLLVWYVLACQCLSTLAVTRRETNSWTWPAVMLGYMTVLAYSGSYLAYHVSLYLGLG